MDTSHSRIFVILISNLSRWVGTVKFFCAKIISRVDIQYNWVIWNIAHDPTSCKFVISNSFFYFHHDREPPLIEIISFLVLNVRFRNWNTISYVMMLFRQICITIMSWLITGNYAQQARLSKWPIHVNPDFLGSKSFYIFEWPYRKTHTAKFDRHGNSSFRTRSPV